MEQQQTFNTNQQVNSQQLQNSNKPPIQLQQYQSTNSQQNQQQQQYSSIQSYQQYDSNRPQQQNQQQYFLPQNFQKSETPKRKIINRSFSSSRNTLNTNTMNQQQLLNNINNYQTNSTQKSQQQQPQQNQDQMVATNSSKRVRSYTNFNSLNASTQPFVNNKNNFDLPIQKPKQQPNKTAQDIKLNNSFDKNKDISVQKQPIINNIQKLPLNNPKQEQYKFYENYSKDALQLKQKLESQSSYQQLAKIASSTNPKFRENNHVTSTNNNTFNDSSIKKQQLTPPKNQQKEISSSSKKQQQQLIMNQLQITIQEDISDIPYEQSTNQNYLTGEKIDQTPITNQNSNTINENSTQQQKPNTNNVISDFETSNNNNLNSININLNNKTVIQEQQFKSMAVQSIHTLREQNDNKSPKNDHFLNIEDKLQQEDHIKDIVNIESAGKKSNSNNNSSSKKNKEDNFNNRIQINEAISIRNSTSGLFTKKESEIPQDYKIQQSQFENTQQCQQYINSKEFQISKPEIKNLKLENSGEKDKTNDQQEKIQVPISLGNTQKCHFHTDRKLIKDGSQATLSSIRLQQSLQNINIQNIIKNGEQQQQSQQNQKQIQQLQSQNIDQQQQILKLQQELQEMKENLGTFQQKNQKQEDEIIELKKNKQQLQQVIDNKNDENLEKDRIILEGKEKNDKLMKTIQQLVQKNKSLDSKKKEVEKLLKNFLLEKEMNQMKLKHETTNNNNKNISNNVQQCQPGLINGKSSNSFKTYSSSQSNFGDIGVGNKENVQFSQQYQKPIQNNSYASNNNNINNYNFSNSNQLYQH